MTTAVSPDAEVSTGIESITPLVVSESDSSSFELLQDAARRLNTRKKENNLNKLFIKCY